uniref:Uncharacterized protein n=1 Tax=Megaselia scalaris TaxID=36166 RepID=T1GZ47_MEGSC
MQRMERKVIKKRKILKYSLAGSLNVGLGHPEPGAIGKKKPMINAGDRIRQHITEVLLNINTIGEEICTA